MPQTMLMIPENCFKIIQDEKTLTTRLPHGDELYEGLAWREPDYLVDRVVPTYSAIKHANGRVRYAVGQTHTVSPGRGRHVMWYFKDTGQITIIPWQNWKDKPKKEWPGYEKLLRAAGFRPLKIRVLLIWRENLKDISVDNARREGCSATWEDGKPVKTAVDNFLSLWDMVNKGYPKLYSVEANPNVIRVLFERVIE